MNIRLIGSASDLGVSVDGSRYAPELLLSDIEDIPSEIMFPEPGIIKSHSADDMRKNEAPLNRFHSRLYSALVSSRSEGDFTILAGGDHSCAIPSVLSSEKVYGDIGVIWIDAHTDFNTFRTTETGNIHGLPLACAAGYECEELRTFHDGKTVDPANVCIIGARSIDREERENLRDAGVTVFSTDDLRTKGIREVVEEAFSVCLNGTGSVHVSFDLDVIDPSLVPGVSVPAPDGISTEEAFDVIAAVTDRIDDVCSFDLVELNPLRDPDHISKDIASEILAKIIAAAQSK
ncbi:MAG: arginase [Oscillospiraceae bacterium]|nr:arginase [Oscillospiraceae bacterium]